MFFCLGEVDCGTRPLSDSSLTKSEINKYLDDKVKTNDFFNQSLFYIIPRDLNSNWAQMNDGTQ